MTLLVLRITSIISSSGKVYLIFKENYFRVKCGDEFQLECDEAFF